MPAERNKLIFKGKKEITDEPRSQFWRKCEEIRQRAQKQGLV